MNKKMTFEEAMEKLEGEVKRLEAGNMTLDESLSSFENAIKLVKVCNEKLETAERAVRILTEAQDGTVSDAPFEVEANET